MSCTIKDIARDTNLSLATISKYLNGKRLSPLNQEKIAASIKKLGYIPNKAAQNLRSRKSDTICILLPQLSDPFWGDICNHIESYMQKNGYYTIIMSYDSRFHDQTKLYMHIASSQISGAIIIPHLMEHINLLSLLQKGGIPFVFADQIVLDVLSDAVTSTNYTSSYAAAKLLIQHGHKRLGVIGRTSNYTTRERVRGFSSACKDFGIPPQDQIIETSANEAADAAAIFTNMLTLSSPPTAIYILGYDLTIASIQQLQELNIQIPNDLSLISFDDDQIFSAFSPPITVVKQNLSQIGLQAAQLLLKRISGDYSQFPEIIYVDTTFIERASVK
ncbi:MAG: LacI family DNA-binding transcriptional regulator [Oscillospiraceae bacterium]